MPRALLILAWTLAVMAQIRPSRPTVPGQGGIEGIVADAASHEPLKKAQVVLSGPTEAAMTVVTDSAGRFAFHALPAGSYYLNASKPGYNPPQALLGFETPGAVSVGEAEQKKGVELRLMPDSAITGRVSNEDGYPVRGCTVSAVQPGYEHNRRSLRSVAGTATDGKGEYRLHNLPPGRYYVLAHCRVELPAAHPLMPPGDPRTPHETYQAQFYGGGPDPSTATRLTLAAGASLGSVDFKVARAPAFTLSGSFTGSDPEALAGEVNVLLLPANRLMRTLMISGAGAEPRSNRFRIASVAPGSYRLFAFAAREGHMFTAQRALEVGATQPDPVELSLMGGAELKGAVRFDSDDHPPLGNCHIALAPVEGPWFVPQPRTQMDNDGSFTLPGVLPGRWRLIVSVPGYVKTVTLGGQQVSPYGFEIAAGAAGPLHIVMGAKLAEVHVSVDGAPPGGSFSALIFPEDSGRWGAGLERAATGTGAGPVDFGALPPGRYRVFATDIQNPWPILQRADLLEALEGRAAAVDVAEGGRARTTVEIIPREELLRALEQRE